MAGIFDQHQHVKFIGEVFTLEDGSEVQAAPEQECMSCKGCIGVAWKEDHALTELKRFSCSYLPFCWTPKNEQVIFKEYKGA